MYTSAIHLLQTAVLLDAVHASDKQTRHTLNVAPTHIHPASLPKHEQDQHWCPATRRLNTLSGFRICNQSLRKTYACNILRVRTGAFHLFIPSSILHPTIWSNPLQRGAQRRLRRVTVRGCQQRSTDLILRPKSTAKSPKQVWYSLAASIASPNG